MENWSKEQQLLAQLEQERNARLRVEQLLASERKANEQNTTTLNQRNKLLTELTDTLTGELAELGAYEMQNPHPVLHVSMSGEVINQNEAARSLTHFRFGKIDLDSSILWARIASVLESEQKEQTLEAISNGRVYSFTARRIDNGGYVIIYGSDISMQKNKQKKVSNRLLKLIENLQSGVLVEDETRHVVQTNSIFCKMLSLDLGPESMIDEDWSTSSEQTKHLFKNPEKYVTRIEELLSKRKLAVGDMLELQDGRFFIRDYVPIYVDTTYSGNLWHFRDVTENIRAEEKLRAREEKYRGIIEHVNMGLIEVNLDGHIRYANHSFCEMSGYSLEELQGESAADKLGNDQVPNSLTHEHYTEVESEKSSEVVVKDKNGEQRWWLFSGAPLLNDLQERVGSICLHIDITSQKMLEVELQEATNKAEESSQAKEVFLANMSHEIRTPMNAILGMSRQLAKTTLSENQSLFLNIIQKASENLLVIINDILDLSKVNAGKLDIENINFNLPEAIDGAVNVLRQKAGDKNLTINVDIADDIAPILVGDPHRLNQVLLNLMGNSIKFTEKGGITVRACIKKKTSSSQKVLLEVSDTGIGMGQEFLLKLFDAFSQEDDSTARQYGGTGLGMNISRKLIELMGGSIKVMSRKNQGTTVSFELDLPIGEEEIIDTETMAIEAQMLDGIHILLAEDNEFNRMVAGLTLEDYGVKLTEAHDGQEAVRALQRGEFDLVLMDVQMPNLDGLQATQQIRSVLKNDIPIIALTAGTLTGEKERCLDAGMNDFVSKPFKEEDLISVICKWVRVVKKVASGK